MKRGLISSYVKTAGFSLKGIKVSAETFKITPPAA